MPSEKEIEAAAFAIYDIKDAETGDSENALNICRSVAKAALQAAEAVRWLPIEKGYIDAEVYICYYPKNKNVEKYQSRILLSIAKDAGATHYMIPQPPTQTEEI